MQEFGEDWLTSDLPLPRSIQEAIVYGALVGLAIYGVYNGTNYAINKQHTLKITVLDIVCSYNCVGPT